MPDVRNELIEKARNYHVSEHVAELLNQNPPLFIAGITASGKDTVAAYIEETSDFRHVVTHTTRLPRVGEINGENYWFVSDEEMLKLVDAGKLIETNIVHSDTVYGTSIEAYETVARNGKNPILTIDIQGIEDISKRVHKARPFFILPPSFDEWMVRLGDRGQMSHTERLKRIRSALIELEHALKNERFIIIVNNEIHETAKEILDGFTDASTQRQNRELIEKLIERIRSQ